MTRLEAFCCAVLIALLVLLIAIPSPAQSDDPHSGQPDHCTNAREAPKAHRCECKKAPEAEGGLGCETEDVHCKVYCHKNKCYCYQPKCDS